MTPEKIARELLGRRRNRHQLRALRMIHGYLTGLARWRVDQACVAPATLTALIRRGLVVIEESHPGHPRVRVTDRGRQVGELLTWRPS